jgi:exodeoxyribonuclease V alpha subunit
MARPRADMLLRDSNLFVVAARVESIRRYGAQHLIRGMETGVVVRSKSEAIVADTLTRLGFGYEYEKKLEPHSDSNDFPLPDCAVRYGGD